MKILWLNVDITEIVSHTFLTKLSCTVWKFQDFTATLILHADIFGRFQRVKNSILTILEASNSDFFGNFILEMSKIPKNTKLRAA